MSLNMQTCNTKIDNLLICEPIKFTLNYCFTLLLRQFKFILKTDVMPNLSFVNEGKCFAVKILMAAN